MLTLSIVASLAAFAASGCRSVATDRERLRSANAFERADAAVQLADSGDTGAIHTLVDLLEDRDAGVRLYAINALERLCGDTRGYRHYASEPERETAVQRWRDALRDGQVRVAAPAGSRSQAAPPRNTAAEAGGRLADHAATGENASP